MNSLTKIGPDPTPDLINRARVLLANAQSLDEVLRVRGIAGAAEKFFKAAHHSREIAQEAAEVRLRASRRAGEMLKEMRQRNERTGQGGDRAKSRAVTLLELGVERMEAHRWQRIAAVPAPNFERYIEECKKHPLDELTTAGLMAEAKLAKKHALGELIRNEPQPLPDGPFRVIVADPPWPYASRGDDPTHRARNPYPDMTLDDIRALPVAARAAEDAVLWLWTTNAFQEESYSVCRAWGFEHKTTLTWVKDQMGTGDWLRGRSEHCLFAVKGRPVVTLTNQSTVLIAPRGRHSEKPDDFYALVESLCPGSKLELFARRPREAWCVWGAESNGCYTMA